MPASSLDHLKVVYKVPTAFSCRWPHGHRDESQPASHMSSPADAAVQFIVAPIRFVHELPYDTSLDASRVHFTAKSQTVACSGSN